MSAVIIRADARCLPIAENSVDLIVTSPPYFALRSYQDGGEHYAGQVGAEATPAEFVDALIACTREWMRVLKPSGSLWVNLGDKYAGGGGQWDKDERPDPGRRRAVSGKIGTGGNTYGLRPKSLIGIPWRYALRCIDELGLILRAEVIWSKPNGLPESVADRVRRSHEHWFHFTLEPRYFSAVDEVREEYAGPQRRGVLTWDQRRDRDDRGARYSDQNGHGGTAGMAQSPLGKLPGSVWTIATEPLRVPDHLGVDHFAAFPIEWPRRIIQGWSPSGVCLECGEGRRPVVANSGAYAAHRASVGNFAAALYAEAGGNPLKYEGKNRRPVDAPPTEKQITGYACACPEPTARTRPAVVLDPFGGTGTTTLVASVLGRLGVSVDLSSDYCRLARWRTTDPGERARAMRVEKPPKQADGQGDLFEVVA